MIRSPLPRLALAAAALGLMAGAAVVARQAPPAAPPMADAARKFLASLDDEQKPQAVFAFDSPERQKWYFTPRQNRRESLRKGLRLDKMTPPQKALAMNLLKSGLSASGYDQAGTIMSLENVLKELEKNGANTRNPEWYFVSIFGEPTATGDWSWRVEGHHLSVNFTLKGGRVVGATPVLFAANPAEVRQGPRKGLRTLPGAQDKAEELIQMFTVEQDRKARREKPFAEVQEGLSDSGIKEPVGVTIGELTDAQDAALTQLIEIYLGRLTPEVAAEEKARVRAAGKDKVHFAYSREETKPGKPLTYRIQGPTFVAEFLNVQADSAGNPANHIHSGWRRLPKDFE